MQAMNALNTTRFSQLTTHEENPWNWNGLKIAWKKTGTAIASTPSIVFIHGFGACKEHWRFNQPILGQHTSCYAIDLIGFGASSQPRARLKNETKRGNDFEYNFDNWGKLVSDFCQQIVQRPVLLIGNSIGGIVCLKAAQELKEQCRGVVLISCATRALDDKQLAKQPYAMQLFRPFLKSLVSQRWLSRNLFRNAASTSVVQQVLKQAYPSGKNIDEQLITMLQKPSKRPGASEAFHGFINLFDDYLAPQLMTEIEIPVDLIWGEKDPWEPIQEAKEWKSSIECI